MAGITPAWPAFSANLEEASKKLVFFKLLLKATISKVNDLQ